MSFMEDKMNEALFNAMLDAEGKQYMNPSPAKQDKRREELVAFINKWGCDQVTICSLTNMGQVTHSIMLDTYDSTKSGGDIEICLGPDQDSWSASRKDGYAYEKSDDSWIKEDEDSEE